MLGLYFGAGNCGRINPKSQCKPLKIFALPGRQLASQLLPLHSTSRNAHPPTHRVCTLLPAIWLMFALGIALQTLALGVPCKYAGYYGSFSQIARKSMLHFLLQRASRLAALAANFVFPFLTLATYVILKSISNRVPTKHHQQHPWLAGGSLGRSLPFCFATFLHENHELVVKNVTLSTLGCGNDWKCGDHSKT